MGANETSKLLHSKGNHKQDEKTTLRMGEKVFCVFELKREKGGAKETAKGLAS